MKRSIQHPASSIQVNLGDRSYGIIFGDSHRTIKPHLYRDACIITDKNVAKYHLRPWEELFPLAQTMILPAGEKTKSMKTMSLVYDFLAQIGFGRDHLIIALGGGVVGDIAGFAAATYMRGVEYIQIPTTLLAMVDASIGGKTGVDLTLGKNLVGAFHQPKAVLVDFNYLKTLPRREWNNGLGEIYKYALLTGEIELSQIPLQFDYRQRAFSKNYSKIVRFCAQYKAGLVSQDERDVGGIRMVLNLGHTFGHAFEAGAGFKALKHGEAVVLGLMGAVFISYKRNLLNKKTFDKIIDELSKFNIPKITRVFQFMELLTYILRDKKTASHNFRMVLLKDIGKPIVVHDIIVREFRKACGFISNTFGIETKD
jgi:3-dehydroquinate synthase